MSMQYRIIARIQANIDEKIIAKIINRGDRQKLRYTDYILGEQWVNAPLITPSKAVTKIMDGQPNDPELRIIFVKSDDTYFDLSFREKQSNILEITLTSFYYPWQKKFVNLDYECSIDLSKYSNLMLNLIEDFVLIDFEIIEN